MQDILETWDILQDCKETSKRYESKEEKDMAIFDISSFFGNNSSNLFSSFNFGDYAAIRNGSYKKLLKSYYAQQNTSSSTSSSNETKKTDTLDTTDTTGLSKMKTEAKGLKDAADAFKDEDLWKKTNGEYDTDKIVSAIKTFANEYNDVIEQSGKVNASDVASDTRFMMSLTSTMSNSLSKIGITVGTDGKLSVNEDTLKEANMTKVKALFSDEYSYSGQVSQKAGSIENSAVRNSSLYTSSGQFTNYFSNYNNWI